MSNSWNSLPSRRGPRGLDENLLDDESRGAWTEPMTIRPFGDVYLVECERGGTHVVALGESNCSCGNATVDPCRHVRRVAIEINRGRLPPPSAESVPCQGCESEVTVAVSDDPPFLCPDCSHGPGDVVVDEQVDSDVPLVVVSSPTGTADEITVPDEDCTVAEYPGNDAYPPSAPVVEAIYPHAVSLSRAPRRYLYPVSRLSPPVQADDQQPLLPPES